MSENAVQGAFGFGRPSGICRACHRLLTDPVSVWNGIGPVCGGKSKEAVEPESKLTTWEQLEKMQPSAPQEVFVFERTEQGPLFNFAQRIVYHSPTGMEFGYGGSGPADAALNVLIHFVDGRKAWALHQDFKWEFIATTHGFERYELHASAIREWLDARGVAHV